MKHLPDPSSNGIGIGIGIHNFHPIRFGGGDAEKSLAHPLVKSGARHFKTIVIAGGFDPFSGAAETFFQR